METRASIGVLIARIEEEKIRPEVAMYGNGNWGRRRPVGADGWVPPVGDCDEVN